VQPLSLGFLGGILGGVLVLIAVQFGPLVILSIAVAVTFIVGVGYFAVERDTPSVR
jgi:lysozyme family protein